MNQKLTALLLTLALISTIIVSAFAAEADEKEKTNEGLAKVAEKLF